MFAVAGQRQFGIETRQHKHEAQASEYIAIQFTRLRFVLVFSSKVALSS